MPNEARMAVPNATAHFTPTIRVAGPEPMRPDEIGDLHRVEPFEPEAAPAPRSAAPAVAKTAPQPEPPEPEPSEADFIEDEIPAVKAGAQWIEETVAIETREEPAPKTGKSFLSRTVIPFSALKITHFWPHSIRKRTKRSPKEQVAE